MHHNTSQSTNSLPHCLPPNSFILLAIPHRYILTTSTITIFPHKKLIIFDTKGNFLLSGIDSVFIPTEHDLYENLLALKDKSNFVLLIDSITNLLNTSLETYKMKLYFNQIWELLYENNADVILVDHYKKVKLKEKWVIKPTLWKNRNLFTHLITVNEDESYVVEEVQL